MDSALSASSNAGDRSGFSSSGGDAWKLPLHQPRWSFAAVSSGVVLTLETSPSGLLRCDVRVPEGFGLGGKSSDLDVSEIPEPVPRGGRGVGGGWDVTAREDADATVYPVEPEDLTLFAPFSRVSWDPDGSPPALVNASGAPTEARRNASLPCGVGVPSETAGFMQQTIPPLFAFAREGTATLPLPMLLSRRPGPRGALGFCAAEETDFHPRKFVFCSSVLTRVRDEHEKLRRRWTGGHRASRRALRR